MKQLCILSLVLLISASAFGQIRHTVLNPVIKLDSWNSQELQIDSDILASDLHASIIIWEDFNTQTNVNTMGNCEVIMENGYPAALDMGAMISATANWQAPNYATLYDGSVGNWQGKADAYLGVRIKENAQWYYGWIKMDVNEFGNVVVIKDYACNMASGDSLTAGQVNATAVPHIAKTDDVRMIKAGTKLSFTGLAGTPATLMMYDMSGKAVAKCVYEAGTSVDMSGHPTGVYILYLQNGKVQKQFKLEL